MCSEIFFRVDGKPHGKGRPRFVKATGRTYTDKPTMSAESRVQVAWMDAGCHRIDGPVTISVGLVLARPKTHRKRDGSLSAEGERTPIPVRKPDLDNALKLVMDALNGHAYRDDVDVVDARVTRSWAGGDEFEHTIVRIRPANAVLDAVRPVAGLVAA